MHAQPSRALTLGSNSSNLLTVDKSGDQKAWGVEVFSAEWHKTDVICEHTWHLHVLKYIHAYTYLAQVRAPGSIMPT